MPTRLLLASSLVSVALLLGLGGAYLLTGSSLALAQAADSLADALTGLGLLWALRVSQRPPDDDHPYGHHGAQPIAALVVAMLVGALALEVLLQAIDAIRGGREAVLGWSVAAGLGIKVAIKAVFAWQASARELLRRNATLRAFRTDALSDVAVGSVSLLGLLAARVFGWPHLDAWLALPVAAWIGISGLGLAKESIDLLMGIAPTRDWQDAVIAAVAEMDGVRGVADFKARSFGDHAHVWVEVHVDPSLSIGQAHDIGEAVERALRQRDGITDAVVHVDAATGASAEVATPPAPSDGAA